jgi:aspartate-semialdehyde dehydrogenase
VFCGQRSARSGACGKAWVDPAGPRDRGLQDRDLGRGEEAERDLSLSCAVREHECVQAGRTPARLRGETELERLSGRAHRIVFTAQVVPMCRGILSCLYGDLLDGITTEQVFEAYRSYHAKHPFVRIFDRKANVGTIHVRGSNFCNLTVDVDERTRTLRVISHIDNLVKGQAGNALQNMNIMFGLPETTGLMKPGMNP